MARIKRNDPCPCGSGKKFKRCCLGRSRPVAPASRPSLAEKVDLICEAAAEKREEFLELGVFILFSTVNGDAWLLEASDQDAVQLAAAGTPLDIELDEGPETITLDWSHTFALEGRQLRLTAYENGQGGVLAGAPCQRIRAAIRRIHRRFGKSLLGQVHLSEVEE